MEAIVNAGNGGSPHQNDNTKVVELIAEFLNVGAVIGDDVIAVEVTNQNTFRGAERGWISLR